MSVPYIPKITTGGQNAAITARENGFAFEVTHVSFGTGLYVHTGNEIALQNEIAKVPIAGGGRVAGMLSLVINTLLKDSDLYVGVNQPVDISEIGFWNDGVLFAIYANNTVLVRKIQDCYIANVYTLALKTLQPIDAANINVVIDEGAAVVLALLGEHLSVTNPHPQYATVLMLQDEALTREQNDLALSIAIAAEITNRENADNGLSGQIAQEVLDRQAGDTTEATARENGDLALAIAIAAEISNCEAKTNNASETNIGISRVATLLELFEGQLDNVFVTPKKLKDALDFVETPKQISFRLTNGLIIKIGSFHVGDIPGAGVIATDYFNTPFSRVLFSFVSGYSSGVGGSHDFFVQKTSQNNSSISAVFVEPGGSSVQSCGFDWLAIGF